MGGEVICSNLCNIYRERKREGERKLSRVEYEVGKKTVCRNVEKMSFLFISLDYQINYYKV